MLLSGNRCDGIQSRMDEMDLIAKALDKSDTACEEDDCDVTDDEEHDDDNGT